MERTDNTGSTRSDSDEQPFPDVYLPAMPELSPTAGRFGRFLADLFRRRGGVRLVVRPRGR